MLQRLELYIQKVIKEEKKGFFPFVLKSVLHIISWGFRLGAFCRNWAFDHNLLRRYHPPVPVVISIGNIVAGGTGKTPVTQMIARLFCKEFTTAILSRGYRSPAEKFSDPLTLSKGAGPIYPPSLCGDEPFLLSQSLPEAHMFVGRNRQKASAMAAKAGADLILLDDGMQHRQLARDYDVVVINANDPFGRGHFLPRGFLRDGPHSLSRAHLIILNHVKNTDHYTELLKKIGKLTKAPVIGTQIFVLNYWDLKGNKIESIQGKRVGIFCGIGNPEQFKSLIQKQEAVIIDEYFVPDHIRPTKDALNRFALCCAEKGADFLICTEKDRVKLTGEWTETLPIVWTQTELRLVEGVEHWEAFIAQAKAKIKGAS